LDQLSHAKGGGFRAVLNLRTVTDQAGFDERSEVERLGMKYLHIPAATANELTHEAASRLGAALSDKNDFPILVHCGSGIRVGAPFALRAVRMDGASTEDAMKIGREYGLTKMEDDVRRILEVARSIYECTR